jgi:hypothetical protein
MPLKRICYLSLVKNGWMPSFTIVRFIWYFDMPKKKEPEKGT